MSVTLYQLALTMIHSVGPITAKQIVSHCGGPEGVFREPKKNLLKIYGIGPKTVQEICDPSVLLKAEKELNFIEKNKVTALFYLDKEYPLRLKNHDDSPLMLFYQGNTSLNYPRTIGIVGTRKPTERGAMLCEKFIRGLAPFDVQVISGLAYGIDAISHRRALAENLPTIGIMGNGLDLTYPSAHRELRKKMTRQGGILTEFPSGTGPEREHFPMRNRIIAAMSDAILVIESAKKGGSMITAHIAFGYNKDIFAIPGRPGDAMSAGPNHLIKANIASLVEEAPDLVMKMLWEKKAKEDRQLSLFIDLDENELKVVNLLKNAPEKSLSIDRLHYQSGMNMSALSGLILQLECKNILRPLPGSRYRLV